VQISLAGLTRLLRRSNGDFPAQLRYLVADPRRIGLRPSQNERLGKQLKVGVLTTSLRKSARVAAAVPDRQHWQPLMSIDAVQWIELDPTRPSTGMESSSDRSIDALAARLAALDLVIGLDEFEMHLAAALGKRCWVVLPPGGGWRWGAGQSTTPWYRSVRLFRAARQAAWPQVMQEMSRELQLLVADEDQQQQRTRSLPAAGAAVAAPKFLRSPPAREGVSWQ
jgi:hypothetical protein